MAWAGLWRGRPGFGTVLSSPGIHSSSHQGAVATWNPGPRGFSGTRRLAGRFELQARIAGLAHCRASPLPCVKGAGKRFWKGRGRKPLHRVDMGRVAIPSPVLQFPSCGTLGLQVGLIQHGAPNSHGVCTLDLDFLHVHFLIVLLCILCLQHTELFSSHMLLCESPSSMEILHPLSSSYRSYLRHHLFLEALHHYPFYFLLVPIEHPVFPILSLNVLAYKIAYLFIYFWSALLQYNLYAVTFTNFKCTV